MVALKTANLLQSSLSAYAARTAAVTGQTCQGGEWTHDPTHNKRGCISALGGGKRVSLLWAVVLLPCRGEQHPEPGKNPYNTMIMVTDTGEVNMVYRCANPVRL
jgi:hypothetical protein